MAWRHPAAAVPALPDGILATRGSAGPALLRLLSRARRRQASLQLVRLGAAGGGALPAAFLQAIASGLRIGDVAWREPGAELLLLLEDTASAAPFVRRMGEAARAAGVVLVWHAATFPEQGFTLEALLEAVAWRH